MTPTRDARRTLLRRSLVLARRVTIVLIALGVGLATTLVATATSRMRRPAPTSAAFELPPRLAALLDSGTWDRTPKGFRIIALSNVADGCAAQASDPAKRASAAECLERVVTQADWLTPINESLGNPRSGLFWAHYALILGARDAVTPDPDPATHERLVRTLLARADADPTLHLPSYRDVAARWPADHAAFLAAVARLDRAHGTDLAKPAHDRWRRWIAKHATDPKTSLPWSEVTGTTRGARHPRGCAESWMIRYLAEIDPAAARAHWDAYRRAFLLDVGPYRGFREWPPGVDLGMDGDSGPIMFGIGASASAFGIAAARAMGDERLARTLEVAADDASSIPGMQVVSSTILAEAIRFAARWQPVTPAGASP